MDKTVDLPIGDCASETCGHVSAGCLLCPLTGIFGEYFVAETHAEQRSL